VVAQSSKFATTLPFFVAASADCDYRRAAALSA